MSDEKDLEWGTPTENDIFAETTAMPIQPDIFKETDAMPLDMEKERARKEANVKSEEISSPVEVDSNEVEDIDLGIPNVAEAEKEYREATGESKGQPEVVTNTVVREIIRTVPSDKASKSDKNSKSSTEKTNDVGVSDTDKIKQVVETVLDEETTNKLSKYEKRRRSRERRRKLGFIIKLLVVLAIAVILYRNDATRERIAILVTDAVDFVQRIVNKDEDSSSNKLVNDALNSLGTKLNDINTTQNTKYIYLDENGNQISEEEYLKNDKAVKVNVEESSEQEESEKSTVKEK